MSRKCETCFLKNGGKKCPFGYACKFPVWERFGNNWQAVRFREIERMEQRVNSSLSSFGAVCVGEVVS